MSHEAEPWRTDNKLDFNGFEANPRDWFSAQAAKRGLTCFLAHADDGVIWGKVEDGQLSLSGEVFAEVAVELRAVTLQQARLFGDRGELLVWRGENGNWHGRYLHDDAASHSDILEEKHRLWGKAAGQAARQGGFTLMRDGAQGMLHAPPLGSGERAVLCVRHYVTYDGQGQAYIALSRLVKVEPGDAT